MIIFSYYFCDLKERPLKTQDLWSSFEPKLSEISQKDWMPVEVGLHLVWSEQWCSATLAMYRKHGSSADETARCRVRGGVVESGLKVSGYFWLSPAKYDLSDIQI
jgi:hypothetical protein